MSSKSPSSSSPNSTPAITSIKKFSEACAAFKAFTSFLSASPLDSKAIDEITKPMKKYVASITFQALAIPEFTEPLNNAVLSKYSALRKEMILVRSFLESLCTYYATRLNLQEFERTIKQLKPFYSDWFQLLTYSENMPLLLGLNLMYLLIKEDQSQFHLELEEIDPDLRLTNPFIRAPIGLDRYLNEGDFDKVRKLVGIIPGSVPPSPSSSPLSSPRSSFKRKRPDRTPLISRASSLTNLLAPANLTSSAQVFQLPEFQSFLEVFSETIRTSIADCQEASYEHSLPVYKAKEALMLESDSALKSFCAIRNWTIQGDRIVFNISKKVKDPSIQTSTWDSTSPDSQLHPAGTLENSVQILKRTLSYVRDIEKTI